jgi:hypothetical protein
LFVKSFSVNIWPAINGKLMNKNNVQIFGGTQVEKHCSNLSCRIAHQLRSRPRKNLARPTSLAAPPIGSSPTGLRAKANVVIISF